MKFLSLFVQMDVTRTNVALCDKTVVLPKEYMSLQA
jgi:hypothetical protein